jgi:preprotein translocase subunit SecF
MIRFSKYIILYAVLSGIVLIPGIFSLIFYGLKPSIDFSGGTLLEVKFSQHLEQSDLESTAKKINLELASIQNSGNNSYILRTKNEENTKFTKFLSEYNAEVTGAATLIRQESVGPVLGKELMMKALYAAVLAILVILCYVAYAFKNFRFGLAAIIALIHDLFVMLGSFAIFGKLFNVEVDTLFVTAALTTMSFSMHDTIVVFDRIREYQKKGLHIEFDEICDRALTETVGRSLTNSMTIILMLIALVLLGGTSIRWFSIALLIGTVSGTYSSDFVATPILILWNRFSHRKKKIITQ